MGRTHPNLLGHWRFEDNLTDTSGNGNNAQVDRGSPSFVKGKIGKGRSYDGSSSDKVPFYAELNSTEITICFWVKRTGSFSDNDQYVGRPVSTSPTQVPYRFYIQNGIFGFATFPPNPASPALDTGGITTTQNVWYHYAGVVRLRPDGDFDIEIWRDGVLVDSVTQGAGVADRISDLFIGGENNRRFANADIDDLQIWNRALAPHQIAAIYNGVDPAFIGDIA